MNVPYPAPEFPVKPRLGVLLMLTVATSSLAAAAPQGWSEFARLGRRAKSTPPASTPSQWAAEVKANVSAHIGADESRTWRARIGASAPEFELSDLDGRTFQLSDHEGKVVVLEWFSPLCPIVKAAHSEGGTLARVRAELEDEPRVVWFAINSCSADAQALDAEANRRMLDELGMSCRLLMDPTGWVGRMYEAEKTPQLVIVDANQRLVYSGGHDDGRGSSLILPALRSVLAGLAPPQAKTRPFGCDIPYDDTARIGAAVVNARLEDLEGVERELADFRGAPLVLEWFNPTCPFTRQAHEAGGVLETAAATWAQRGVRWLAVNSGHPAHRSADPQTNKDAMTAWGLVHPLLLDPRGLLGVTFQASATPHLFVLDERGVLVYSGAHDNQKTPPERVDYLANALEQLLSGREVTPSSTVPYGCSIKFGRR